MIKAVKVGPRYQLPGGRVKSPIYWCVLGGEVVLNDMVKNLPTELYVQAEGFDLVG